MKNHYCIQRLPTREELIKDRQERFSFAQAGGNGDGKETIKKINVPYEGTVCLSFYLNLFNPEQYSSVLDFTGADGMALLASRMLSIPYFVIHRSSSELSWMLEHAAFVRYRLATKFHKYRRYGLFPDNEADDENKLLMLKNDVDEGPLNPKQTLSSWSSSKVQVAETDEKNESGSESGKEGSDCSDESNLFVRPPKIRRVA